MYVSVLLHFCSRIFSAMHCLPLNICSTNEGKKNWKVMNGNSLWCTYMYIFNRWFLPVTIQVNIIMEICSNVDNNKNQINTIKPFIYNWILVLKKNAFNYTGLDNNCYSIIIIYIDIFKMLRTVCSFNKNSDSFRSKCKYKVIFIYVYPMSKAI